MIPSTTSGSNMILSKPLLVMPSVVEFHMNFNLSIIVLCVVLSSILIIASPDISSMNGASTFINFCSLGFSTICSFGKMGKESRFRFWFRMLRQQSHEFIRPSNSKIFLIPRTKYYIFM